jgi:hypothetical protein
MKQPRHERSRIGHRPAVGRAEDSVGQKAIARQDTDCRSVPACWCWGAEVVAVCIDSPAVVRAIHIEVDRKVVVAQNAVAVQIAAAVRIAAAVDAGAADIPQAVALKVSHLAAVQLHRPRVVKRAACRRYSDESDGVWWQSSGR